MTTPPSALDFRTIDLRGRSLSLADLRAVVPRLEAEQGTAVEDAVRGIISDVRSGGFAALSLLAEKFDGVTQRHPRVPIGAISAALESLNPGVREALEESIRRARLFADAQRPSDVTVHPGDGARVTQRWVPVRRVGLYVPGGLAVYPSSVVMNVVPAQAAGVASIALASPPQHDNHGLPHPTILAAAALLGIDEVYAIGGAQAVVTFAYGIPAAEDSEGPLPAIEPADVVTGPGNIFVATAKRLVKGVVGIDAEAGPTEIAILADATARAELVAADLISQAEHDTRAGSVLVTDSAELIEAVRERLVEQAELTKHRDRVLAALSGRQSGAVLVDDIEAGVAVCDAYAAEHLEIMTEEASAVAARIRNAGAIFVGDYSPVSLGDYTAGSNHVLPTSGTAAFSSGLNVATFLKAVQIVDYSEAALDAVARHIRSLSDAEDLPAHGDAVDRRFVERAVESRP